MLKRVEKFRSGESSRINVSSKRVGRNDGFLSYFGMLIINYRMFLQSFTCSVFSGVC